ncbi:MAG TPA: N-formylglutamate amidohydrolase [Paracoccaceae bacterium]|nr:N-formylglutamate amidohydrolase [Paracoccaceae bacterium]
MSMAPFRLTEPVRLTTGVVFNSPHSGDHYPPELIARTRLDRLQLRASEDALVDRLFAGGPRFGAPLLAATAPRAWVDLNRGPAELDPALIEGVRATGLNQRIAAGLGVVPRIVSEGAAIYNGKLTLAEAHERIRTVHAPYHARLEALLTRARDVFGAAILFDCHSMPSEALRAAPRVRGRVPEIVLGDRFGASAARDIVAETQGAFEAMGFIVARNAPFAGGYITQRYGRPSRGLNAIQIEIDRGLYLDQRRIEPNAAFGEVVRRIERVVAALTLIEPGAVALAAE